jgi:hypothetical protein
VQEHAGRCDLYGDRGRPPVGHAEPKVHPADAGQLGAEVDVRDRVGKQGRERDARQAGDQPDGLPRLRRPSVRGVCAAATVIARPDLRATAGATRRPSGACG